MGLDLRPNGLVLFSMGTSEMTCAATQRHEVPLLPGGIDPLVRLVLRFTVWTRAALGLARVVREQ